MTKKVLLVGESWVSSSTHFKGFDQFGSVTFHKGCKPLLDAMKGTDYEVTHMPAHEAQEDFPFTIEGIREWDIIIISDIGSSTFLLPQKVWIHSQTAPNRLRLLKDWVEEGGKLIMAGGYFSFQGIDGKARWRNTAVEEVLPVKCHPWDDRIEIPEGAQAHITDASHPLVKDMPNAWPPVLGVNEVVLKEGAELVATLPADQGGHPLLAAGKFGKGRSVVWTSDMSPHWLSPEFCAWEGYKQLWLNMFAWLEAND
ncbi:glutamine amidotransferase [Pseudogemmobacter faecipullorum]|uniref:Cytoplasmic protein n=1 Tax=Pseudogemmobacter faecipullorum TaxID=2755041 RepID=A0ABS8CND6_9RHOB|nr:glutamine amidotransferase [Pseudogemmobacter faecipullorum]MCB5410889.1 cytoplasmic protein [Pseudogemmobacter faecipullorum]